MIRKIFFHNFVIIYRISQWLRSRLTNAGLLIISVLIASAIFGLNTRLTLSHQIVAILFSLIVLSFITNLIPVKKPKIQRLLPQFGTTGEILEYRILIRNDSRKPLYNLTLFDNLAYRIPTYTDFITAKDLLDKKRNFIDRFIGYPRFVSLVRKRRGADIQPKDIDIINGKESCEKKISLMPLRRGYIYFNETIIGKSDPCGLLRKLIRHRQKDSLLILPKLYQCPDILLPGTRKYQQGGMSLASSVGESEEFFSIREYRPGDPLKAIHWRSYAKKGEPVIKEYQDEYFSRLGLVLDTCVEGQPDFLFEDAVSVAASVTNSRKQRDQLLDLMFINNKAYRFTSGRGLAGVDNVLEILACVEPSFSNNFDELSDLVMNHINETSGLILIYLDWDEKRRNLVREIRARGIPLQVFVMSVSGEIKQSENDPMLDAPDFFSVLKAGELEQSLQKML